MLGLADTLNLIQRSCCQLSIVDFEFDYQIIRADQLAAVYLLIHRHGFAYIGAVLFSRSNVMKNYDLPKRFQQVGDCFLQVSRSTEQVGKSLSKE